MMTPLIQYFINHPRVTHMIVTLICIMGIFTALTLQRQGDPTISWEIMKIVTLYPGAAPEDVEINVTSKIEEELLKVSNIKKLKSTSMENMSVIIAEIDSDAGDAEKTKRNIRDAVNRVGDLPATITQKPVVIEIDNSNPWAMAIAISGDAPESTLRKYVRELESLFREVPGVSSITKSGYRKREIQIDVNVDKMKEHSVSFGEIIHAIQSRNIRTTGGTIESYVSEKKIITLSEYENPLDVRDAIVRSNYKGYCLRLHEIAEITDGFEEPMLLYRGNGAPAILMSVFAQEKEDVIRLCKKLQKRFETFKENIPENIKAEITGDASDWIPVVLNLSVTNLFIGLIFVLIVMFIFLDVKSAFWSAFGIPFSILGALIFFPLLGITLHYLAIVAIILVLGIVVDDAIVITERIFALKKDGMDPLPATLTGVQSMIMPVTTGVVTTMIAFVPMMFVPGIIGKYAVDIPKVIILVLSFSLIEAILFIPSHIRNAVPPKTTPRHIRWFDHVKAQYQSIILYALHHRKKVMAGYLILLMVIVVLSGMFLKFLFLEQADRSALSVKIETPRGSSLLTTNAMIPDVEKIVEETVPEEALDSIITTIGHHDTTRWLGEGGQDSNQALIMIYLVPAQQRTITFDEIVDTLRKKMEVLKTEKGYQMLSVGGAGGLEALAGNAVDITYISDDDQTRRIFEKDTIAFLNGINGVLDIETSNKLGKDELRLNLDYGKLAMMGFTAFDVAQTVRTAFDGIVVTSIRRGGEEIDYRVRIKNPRHFRAERILDIPVKNSNGKMVLLGHFVRFEEKKGPALIYHDMGKRSIRITANVNSKIITPVEVNRILREKFEKKAAMIPGLRMKLGGQEEEMSITLQGFYFALVVAALVIYFLLVAFFDSFLQPIMIMSIIPFAVAGVCLAFLLHHLPITAYTLIGMLGLIGVVINDTIVMINHININCKEKGFTFTVIAQAALDRFKPVILTTLTTFVCLLPTSYGIGGDLPELRSMVLTVAWGLVFATIITLGFIPILYSIVKRATPENK